MKNTLIILFLFLSTTIVAQQGKQYRIKALKVSYITNAINLTANEAEKFWPVYNKYESKLKQLKFDAERGIMREINLAGGFDALSNKQALQILEKAKKIEQETTNTKKAMVTELLTIISAKKILKLLKAEKEFNRKLLNEFSKRRGMN